MKLFDKKCFLRLEKLVANTYRNYLISTTAARFETVVIFIYRQDAPNRLVQIIYNPFNT